MKSLIVFLVLLVCPQLSLAAVDAWRMNQFTGKPDYYQTGIDSTTIEAIAVSTTALAAQTSALDISTQALASRATALESSTSTLEGRVDGLEISTATLDATLAAEILVRQALSTEVAIDTSALETSKISEPTVEGSNGEVLITDGAGGRTWGPMSGGGVSLDDFNIWQSTNIFNSILMSSGTHGAGDDLAIAGAGSRFFYYPKKSAFRAGQITGTEWDDGSIGLWSGAVGYNCKGVGEGSMCFGYSSETTGHRSVALGTGAKAGGEGMAFGPNTVENYGGGQSVSLGGEGNAANVSRSAIVGGYSNRVGPTSGASNGQNSFIAGGSGNTTEADYSGIIAAVNVNLDASADNSVAMGHDASPVTYSSSETLILHNMNLVVSTSPTGVQYGIEKDGDVTADDIVAVSFTGSGSGLTGVPDGALSSNVALKNIDNNFSQTQTSSYGFAASTMTTTSTATLAALSVTGAAAFAAAAQFNAVATATPTVTNALYKQNMIGAWAYFDGTTSPPTLTSGFNISALIKNGVGDYTVYFANDFAAGNAYICLCTTGRTEADDYGDCVVQGLSGTSSTSIATYDSASTNTDRARVSLLCVGAQ